MAGTIPRIGSSVVLRTMQGLTTFVELDGKGRLLEIGGVLKGTDWGLKLQQCRPRLMGLNSNVRHGERVLPLTAHVVNDRPHAFGAPRAPS